MEDIKRYDKTKLACYIGFATQGIVSNFIPLLFLRFHNEFGIALSKIALIPVIFFIMQILIDIISTKYIDKIGYRAAVIIAESCQGIGLLSLSFLPSVMKDPFIGIIICVIVYACGSGLTDVVISPIIEACPFKNKEVAMSMLHSFYCWGSVFVILVSTIYFIIFGVDNWRPLAIIWGLIPLYNITNFFVCPINALLPEGSGLKVVELFMIPIFWVLVLLMICSGASELAMQQWASAFTESALRISKTSGDLLGPCLFAFFEGVARLFYGRFGEKVDLKKFMILSSILCLICYILASFSNIAFVGLIGLILCGFSVGIMWPGGLSIASKTIPVGGTAMFALLAMAGDIGGSLGPGLVGNIAEKFGDNLKVGISVGMIFPILLAVSVVALIFYQKKHK